MYHPCEPVLLRLMEAGAHHEVDQDEDLVAEVELRQALVSVSGEMATLLG